MNLYILTVRHILVECNNFGEKKRMYFVREIWWNHLDSIPHSFYYIEMSASFIITFNLYIYALYAVFIILWIFNLYIFDF